jgi:glycosyltransferase involved in cell wall biosynthesis
MSRRRVLILCYFYPPLAGGGVHRVLSFTRHLPAHGWDCSVVCASAADYWVTDETLATPDDTEVLRVAGGSALSALLRLRRADRGRRPGRDYERLRHLSDWWLLPDSYAGWAARAGGVAARRLARGDVHAVISSSPPDSVHLAALGVTRRHRLPWIADFRDPWVGLWFREPPTRWHRARQAAFERRVLEGCDLVLAASHTHAERVGERSGARPRRVEHLPNGFEPERAGEPVTASDHFSIVFTGTLSLMPDTEVFLEALHELLARVPEARRRLRARLVGPYDSGYQDRAVALGLRGIVEFTGPRPHDEARALQRGADLLLLWKPRGYPTMVPGKLYEYLDSGRPVLALVEPGDEAGALVARAGGTTLPAGDRGALAHALESRYRAWREGGGTAAARPGWLDEFSRARLAGRLAGMLDGLAEDGGERGGGRR